MSNLQIRLFSNDFVTPLALAGITVQVQQMSWNAIGGPEAAVMSATGPSRALVDLANHLRAPVEVWDPVAGAVWWGYVSQVEVALDGSHPARPSTSSSTPASSGLSVRSESAQDGEQGPHPERNGAPRSGVEGGAVHVGVSLDAMANRIAVAYTRSSPGSSAGGQHAITAWAEDAGSIAAYGYKERIESLSEASDAQANQLRETLLEKSKYPIPSIRRAAVSIPGTAELRARGWWDTLGWRYYARSADIIEGAPGAPDTQVHLGDSSESVVKGAVAQKFQFTGGAQWFAETISVWVDKSTRSVAQTLTVALCAYDTAGSPGAVLASATLASGDLVGGDWNEFALNTRVALTHGAWYWVKVSVNSTGATWYALQCQSGGAIVLRIQNAATLVWADASPACELKYRIGCVRENTDQIRTAIETSGQFITGVYVDQTSGLHSNVYRNGATTCLQVVQDLMSEGTTNGLALLAEVDRNRRVRIYEAPARPGARESRLIMDGAGNLYDEWGNRWNGHVSPVGKKCAVRDAALPTLDATRVANPGIFFVERAIFDARTEELELGIVN